VVVVVVVVRCNNWERLQLAFISKALLQLIPVEYYSGTLRKGQLIDWLHSIQRNPGGT
jgi:hypothetical protein